MSESGDEFRFAVLLDRIEVDTDTRHGLPPETIWNVHLAPSHLPSDITQECVVLGGYLRRNGPEGFGQARARGVVWGRSIDVESESSDRWELFLEELNRNFVESIYDTARRALQAQAAQMDFAFDLDVNAPAADIHVPVFEEEDDSSEKA